MSAATLTEPTIADYLRAQAAGLAKELPEIRDLRVSVGSTNAQGESIVTVSGFVRGADRLSMFHGPTIAAAAKQARDFINL